MVGGEGGGFLIMLDHCWLEGGVEGGGVMGRKRK